jgi:hypothetical protein
MSIDILVADSPLPVLGFQNAVEDASGESGWSGPVIYTSGCLQSDGSYNCSIACQDSDQVFTSMETFENCLTYPVITSLMAFDNLTDESLNFAQSYGFIVDADIIETTNDTLWYCFKQYCEANPDQQGCSTDPCYGWPDDTLQIEAGYQAGYPWDTCLYLDVCSGLPAYVNSDVGGVGVSQGVVYEYPS